jgi:DNA-binding NtrC family response regulator
MHTNPPGVRSVARVCGDERLPIRKYEMEDDMIGEFEVLVAASSVENRSAITKVLLGMGVRPAITSSVKEARAILSTKSVSLVFCEEKFADGNYQDVLRAVKKNAANAPVVVSSPSHDWNEYLEALRLGAFEFMDGPVRALDVEMIVRYARRLADAAERSGRSRSQLAARVA